MDAFYTLLIDIFTITLVIFLAPFQFFISQPQRIALVAGLLFVVCWCSLFSQRRGWPLAVACAGWVLFAIWEQFSKEAGMAIRIDLIVIVPVVYVLIIWGVLTGFRRQET